VNTRAAVGIEAITHERANLLNMTVVVGIPDEQLRTGDAEAACTHSCVLVAAEG